MKQLATARTWRNTKPCLQSNVKEKQYLKLYGPTTIESVL